MTIEILIPMPRIVFIGLMYTLSISAMLYIYHKIVGKTKGELHGETNSSPDASKLTCDEDGIE